MKARGAGRLEGQSWTRRYLEVPSGQGQRSPNRAPVFLQPHFQGAREIRGASSAEVRPTTLSSKDRGL